MKKIERKNHEYTLLGATQLSQRADGQFPFKKDMMGARHFFFGQLEGKPLWLTEINECSILFIFTHSFQSMMTNFPRIKCINKLLGCGEGSRLGKSRLSD